MEPKKPRSKTLVFVFVLALVLVGLAAYYAVALMNSDNRPRSVETQSAITVLPLR